MARKIIKNISPLEIKNPKQIDLLSPWNLKKISKVECIRKSDAKKILKIKKYGYSASFCTSNQVSISTFRECRSNQRF